MRCRQTWVTSMPANANAEPHDNASEALSSPSAKLLNHSDKPIDVASNPTICTSHRSRFGPVMASKSGIDRSGIIPVMP